MQGSYRRPVWVAIALALVAALTTPAVAAASGSEASGSEGNGSDRVYLVTVENLTSGQPFTPPVAATHHRRTGMFTVGDPASNAIQGLAENGDVPGLVAELQADPRVDQIVVADAEGPVLPGGSVSFEITASGGHRRLSIASMLICTNDGFTGLDGARLPRHVGDEVEYETGGYDAGTEIDTEDFDDLVPPCGPLTGVDSMGAGTAMSDPALAEGGVITTHSGIAGVADLIPAIHDFDDDVLEVEITRVA